MKKSEALKAWKKWDWNKSKFLSFKSALKRLITVDKFDSFDAHEYLAFLAGARWAERQAKKRGEK